MSTQEHSEGEVWAQSKGYFLKSAPFKPLNGLVVWHYLSNPKPSSGHVSDDSSLPPVKIWLCTDRLIFLWIDISYEVCLVQINQLDPLDIQTVIKTLNYLEFENS